jgi:citrate synthase
MQNIVSSVSQALGGQPILSYDGSLSVLDNRTGKVYSIPIERNAIKATDLKQIKADSVGADIVDQVEGGLRVLDPGFYNTAVVESAITFMYAIGKLSSGKVLC